MTIDSEQFERGQVTSSLERDILDLLYENPETAFTIREITVEVVGEKLSTQEIDHLNDLQPLMTDVMNVAAVNTILERLVDNAHVDRRLIETEERRLCYYRAPSTVDRSAE